MSPPSRAEPAKSTLAQPGGPRPTPPPGHRRIGLVLAPLVIFAAMAALFAFALRTGDPSRLPSALIGRPAPAITLEPVQGLIDGGAPVAGFATADLAKGKPTVVNFWASWCVPCVDEHPLLIRLRAETGIEIIGINHKDLAANARRFLARYGNPFARVGVDRDGRAAIEWGVYGMPETFVVDGQGVIVYKHVGPLTPGALERLILPAIEKARGR